MRIQRGRTLPLKVSLLGPNGASLDASKVKSPPKVGVRFRTRSGKEVNRTSSVEAGDFGKGGRLVFRESYWKFDLMSDALPELGTYKVEVVSGDETEYRVEPTCTLLVTIE